MVEFYSQILGKGAFPFIGNRLLVSYPDFLINFLIIRFLSINLGWASASFWHNPYSERCYGDKLGEL